MPSDGPTSVQLGLFIEETPAYREALDRYDLIQPLLTKQRTLREQSEATRVSYWRLRRYLQQFARKGLIGLVDRRRLKHRRGKPPVEEVLPVYVQQQVVRLAIAHPFTYRELARIVEVCHGYTVDHHGIRRLLEIHHLSTEVLKTHHQQAQQAVPPPPLPTSEQLELSFTPRALSLSQRLTQAVGPEHLLIRFRTYREYRV